MERLMSLKAMGCLSDYPICATLPQISHGSFCDIDEQAAQLAGHDQAYQQLSAGAFRGQFMTVELSRESCLFVEETNQALFQHGIVPADQASFMFLLGETRGCRFQGGDFTSADLAVMPPSGTFSVHCPANTSFCVLTIDRSFLDDTLWLNPHTLPAHAYRLQSRQLGMIVGALRLLVRTSLSILVQNPGQVRSTETILNLRQSFVSTLKLALSTDVNRSQNKDVGLFAQARRTIDAHLREISVADLCRVLGVPRRTLEWSFQEEIGIGPSRYIKALRLNHIRREIAMSSSARSIADIAASWGIWHPSHFTESYAQMFDEKPGDTRRKATRS
jgi:AraC family ethanolamine operon transcriptional activator